MKTGAKILLSVLLCSGLASFVHAGAGPGVSRGHDLASDREGLAQGIGFASAALVSALLVLYVTRSVAPAGKRSVRSLQQ
jgi:hypothetical protein